MYCLCLAVPKTLDNLTVSWFDDMWLGNFGVILLRVHWASWVFYLGSLQMFFRQSLLSLFSFCNSYGASINPLVSVLLSYIIFYLSAIQTQYQFSYLTVFFFFSLLKCAFKKLCVCTYTPLHLCGSPRSTWLGFFLPPGRFWGLTLGHQTWRQSIFPHWVNSPACPSL